MNDPTVSAPTHRCAACNRTLTHEAPCDCPAARALRDGLGDVQALRDAGADRAHLNAMQEALLSLGVAVVVRHTPAVAAVVPHPFRLVADDPLAAMHHGLAALYRMRAAGASREAMDRIHGCFSTLHQLAEPAS